MFYRLYSLWKQNGSIKIVCLSKWHVSVYRNWVSFKIAWQYLHTSDNKMSSPPNRLATEVVLTPYFCLKSAVRSQKSKIWATVLCSLKQPPFRYLRKYISWKISFKLTITTEYEYILTVQKKIVFINDVWCLYSKTF